MELPALILGRYGWALRGAAETIWNEHRTLAIVFLVLLVVSGGWYLWDRHKDESDWL